MTAEGSKMLRISRVMIVVGLLLQMAAVSYALQQPNGTAIPSAMGCDSGSPTGLAAEFACQCDSPGVCNIGPVCAQQGNCPAPPSNNCETTLWHEFNDNTCIPSNRSGLDPWNDGALTPEVYTPTCALTFTLVSRGTAIFKDVFGWYNVTGDRPSPEDLHVMLDCNSAPGQSVELDVRSEPEYAGGEIGFFIATPEQHGQGGQCAGGNCCASIDRVIAGEGHIYYSERRFNPDESGSDSLIHLLVYDSRITDHKFYFAWEDIYGGSNNDFSDLITSVEGVECAEGGTACDTGEAGICGHGVTTCEGEGVECMQLYDPVEEKCDSADNDCDGEVDEDFVCDDDVVASCDGACEDACENIACTDGETCRGGVCFPGCNQCNGIVCGSDESCDLGTGHCIGAGDNPGADAGSGGGGTGEGELGEAVGCGCQASSPGTLSALLWVGLLGLFLRRRRAR
jgi:MYXO-CTERM domain-containing protein